MAERATPPAHIPADASRALPRPLDRDALLRGMVRRASKEHAMPEAMVRAVLAGEEIVPYGIFAGEASPMEAIVVYLHDVRGLRFAEIARLTDRDPRAINMSYRNARGKTLGDSGASSASTGRIGMYWFPVARLKNTKFTPLEHICLRVAEIARILGKDHTTVWTALARAKRK
jgi:hypothetical protein